MLAQILISEEHSVRPSSSYQFHVIHWNCTTLAELTVSCAIAAWWQIFASTFRLRSFNVPLLSWWVFWRVYFAKWLFPWDATCASLMKFCGFTLHCVQLVEVVWSFSSTVAFYVWMCAMQHVGSLLSPRLKISHIVCLPSLLLLLGCAWQALLSVHFCWIHFWRCVHSLERSGYYYFCSLRWLSDMFFWFAYCLPLP